MVKTIEDSDGTKVGEEAFQVQVLVNETTEGIPGDANDCDAVDYFNDMGPRNDTS